MGFEVQLMSLIGHSFLVSVLVRVLHPSGAGALHGNCNEQSLKRVVGGLACYKKYWSLQKLLQEVVQTPLHGWETPLLLRLAL